MALVRVIHTLMAGEKEFAIKLVSRNQNKVSHGLALDGRTTPRITVWLGPDIEEIVNLCMNDIMPP